MVYHFPTGVDRQAGRVIGIEIELYSGTLIKKENKIFLIYEKIQMGSGAKSFMRKGFLICEEMHKYIHYI
jgi:hypothetical protein